MKTPQKDSTHYTAATAAGVAIQHILDAVQTQGPESNISKAASSKNKSGIRALRGIMNGTSNLPLSAAELECCTAHGVDIRFIEVGSFTWGGAWVKHFVRILQETRPGSMSREQMHNLAFDRAEADEAVPSEPGTIFRPFRFCSP